MSWITPRAAGPGPCGSPAPCPRPGQHRRRRSRVCGRTPEPEDSGQRPTAPPTPPDPRQPATLPARHRAVVSGPHIEHIQLSLPRRPGIQGRARHGAPDQLAVSLGDSHTILAVALVGQRRSPEPLPYGLEAWVVEHSVRHQAPVRLLQHRTFIRAICPHPRPEPGERPAQSSPPKWFYRHPRRISAHQAAARNPGSRVAAPGSHRRRCSKKKSQGTSPSTWSGIEATTGSTRLVPTHLTSGPGPAGVRAWPGASFQPPP